MKTWLKRVGFFFSVMFALGVIINLVDPEGVKRRRAQQTAKKSVKDEPGFTVGFLEGSVRKSRGFRKPSSDEVDALARQSANENNVPQDERSYFVGNYTQAFWMGWNRAK